MNASTAKMTGIQEKYSTARKPSGVLMAAPLPANPLKNSLSANSPSVSRKSG